MKQFKFYNKVIGWFSFVVASFTYLLTIEPTASFWDCGEFIATAVKLEVGHPPGAPLWMIIGRIAALFAGGDVTKMAMMINAAAALASAFTVLFLFWSITHIARKMVNNIYYSKIDEKQIEYSIPQIVVILGSGLVGSLIYCFCDTAWFSAVEGEVYSMSSFFTAIVFWCILKWEECADEKYSNRWIILICYLMGLSIGVHLLNLLVIPAIVFVYYHKKYTPNRKRTIMFLLLSVVVLAFVLYGIIPQSVKIAAYFDLFFVNVLGFGYLSGMIVFLILLFGGLSFLIWWSYKNGKVLLNTIALGVTVMMIGYGTFAMTVIRSCANTPINENCPDNGFNLLSYLNRDQYGDTPLLYGNYYNADVIEQEKIYTYIPQDGKYVEVEKTNPKYIYDDAHCGVFPRMHSQNANHISAYKNWANITSPDDVRPSFADNLAFFFNYQLGHMYFRYFMWNFSGRQNDIQSHGSYINGNWITGIDFLDELRIGDQSLLPDTMKNNHARNVYYLLPLLLGFLGLFAGINHDQKYCFVIFLFFILTGVAIVVYLNQTPYQPRERDYAYAGSFYAFAMWCGLGVIGIYEFIRKHLQNKENLVLASAISGLCLFVPIEMACQNWDDHDRSNRYTCRDFAIDYLESCAPNAILFTFGDNDTFPLWYAQEVEGVRTDVRIVNLSLAGTDWYLKQSMEKKYDSEPVPFILSADKYAVNKRNVALVYETPYLYLNEKIEANPDIVDSIYGPLFDDFFHSISNSKFPQLFAKDYELLKQGRSSLNPLKLYQLIGTLSSKQNSDAVFENNTAEISTLKTRADNMISRINSLPAPIKAVISFIGSEKEEDKIELQSREKINFIGTKTISIPVNIENCKANGTLDDSNLSKVKNSLTLPIKKSYLLKNDIAVLDIIAANDWKRPIYFAASGGTDDYLGLDKFFRLEGLAYRLMPYETKSLQAGDMGEINGDIMYENVMNKFKWGNMQDPSVTIEENNRRQINIIDVRGTFARLADQLIAENKTEKAINVLNRCLEILPSSQVAYDQTMLPVVEALYKAGMTDKAVQISEQMADEYSKILAHFQNLKNSGVDENREASISLAIIGALGQYAMVNQQDAVYNKVSDIYSRYSMVFN
ncbi:MAG: DUF2723 domain-containing protein [Bacteroidales bacterium]|nr:DUF2723 domain-containing protein [Bacteroidales bacterium]